MLEPLKKVVIYTDGACSGNPGPGGWGAVLSYKDNIKEIFGCEKETTNNKMELLAVIEALKLLKNSCEVEINTDSQYVKKGITEWIFTWMKKSWKSSSGQPVKNVDLWKQLYAETKKHTITWHWVKGHSGNKGNELADSLAVKGKELAMQKLLCQ